MRERGRKIDREDDRTIVIAQYVGGKRRDGECKREERKKK